MCALLVGCTSERPLLRLGATHTLEQSGALALLDSAQPPARLAVVVGPSGQMLDAAARGDLDVVIAHAPTLEERLLVTPGHAALRCPFVESRFAVVGPSDDPAGVSHARNAADAFTRIARAGAVFVSRGDSSGTHVRERALWTAAGVRPDGAPWYVESGADQAATLHVAGERGGYALADLPTFARTRDVVLQSLYTSAPGDPALVNVYTLYVIRSAAPRSAADEFAVWALRAWRPRLLELRLPDGSPAFTPAAGACGPPGGPERGGVDGSGRSHSELASVARAAGDVRDR